MAPITLRRVNDAETGGQMSSQNVNTDQVQQVSSSQRQVKFDEGSSAVDSSGVDSGNAAGLAGASAVTGDSFDGVSHTPEGYIEGIDAEVLKTHPLCDFLVRVVRVHRTTSSKG
jgi:hypothetical protein